MLVFEMLFKFLTSCEHSIATFVNMRDRSGFTLAFSFMFTLVVNFELILIFKFFAAFAFIVLCACPAKDPRITFWNRFWKTLSFSCMSLCAVLWLWWWWYCGPCSGVGL